MAFKQRLDAMRAKINLRSRRVTRFLHPSVLWYMFAVFVAASTGTFAASWLAGSDRSNLMDPDGSCSLDPDDRAALDSGFYNLLSQTFLTLIASWCTVHPFLHDHLSKRRSIVELPAHTFVFILSFLTTVCTAVAAPITYARLRQDAPREAENIGNTMNFVSTFFTVVTASQLAGGVMRIMD